MISGIIGERGKMSMQILGSRAYWGMLKLNNIRGRHVVHRYHGPLDIIIVMADCRGAEMTSVVVMPPESKLRQGGR